MPSELAKFDFKSGFNRETTQYAEGQSWYDGNRVRFRAARPENMRGYETRAEGTTFDGSARDLLVWSDAVNVGRAIFGTPDKLECAVPILVIIQRLVIMFILHPLRPLVAVMLV
mgnify:CR=1 FL=1